MKALSCGKKDHKCTTRFLRVLFHYKFWHINGTEFGRFAHLERFYEMAGFLDHTIQADEASNILQHHRFLIFGDYSKPMNTSIHWCILPYALQLVTLSNRAFIQHFVFNSFFFPSNLYQNLIHWKSYVSLCGALLPRWYRDRHWK